MKTIILMATMLLTFGFAQAQCGDMVFKIKDGELRKYNLNGSYQGDITSDAKKVKIQGDITIVTKNNGDMRKYNFSGSYQGDI